MEKITPKTETADERCRVCLECLENSVLLNTSVSINGNSLTYLEILYKISEIKVDTNTNLPQKLCSLCAEKAETSISFKTQCERSDKLLREELAFFSQDFQKSSSDCYKLENSSNDEYNSDEEMREDPELSTIPRKSRNNYQKTYMLFMKWRQKKGHRTISQDIILTYFNEISKNVNPATLWARFSMLKSTLNIKNKIDIGRYHKVLTFLKEKNKGYMPKRSKIFTRDEICKFLREADDIDYLMVKVVVLFGLIGGCRKTELTNLSYDHIDDKGNYLIIRIPDIEYKKERFFTITEAVCHQFNGIDFLGLYHKYASLRPQHISHSRVFLNYKKGKCTCQAVGKNTLGRFPKIIAEYLKLPNPEEYTGNSFRRTSNKIFNKMSLSVENFTSNIETVPLESPLVVGKVEVESGDDNSNFMEMCSSGLTKYNTSRETMKQSNSPTNDASLYPYDELHEDPELASIPKRSRINYQRIYKIFVEWCHMKSYDDFSENVLLTHFTDIASDLSPTTLWTRYSMLKSTLSLKHDIDIGKYTKLLGYLKNVTKGYQPKKSRTFTKEQICTFLKKADDNEYLMLKVAVVLGIAGGCRRFELTNLYYDHIEDKGTYLVVRIPDAKTQIERVFTVTEAMSDQFGGIDFIEIFRKYVRLRPSHTKNNRLFLNYKKGKCTIQPVGVNTLGKVPKQIAEYLKLPFPDEYTGNSFRRSSADILANSDMYGDGDGEQAGTFEKPDENVVAEPSMSTSGIMNSIQNDDSTDNAESACEDLNDEPLAQPNKINLPPLRSSARYESCYRQFIDWCHDTGVTGFTEDTILAYFATMKDSQLSPKYSMLKTMLYQKNKVDISKYHLLLNNLKSRVPYCQTKKIDKCLFTREQICMFLKMADDKEHLFTKMVIIFAVIGGCRTYDMSNILLKNVEDKGSYLTVKLCDSKTQKERFFSIDAMNVNLDGIDVLEIFRKYLRIRQRRPLQNRLFLRYVHGKCFNQVVGIHSFAKVPKIVASYLGLPNPENYTAYTLKRSAIDFAKPYVRDISDGNSGNEEYIDVKPFIAGVEITEHEIKSNTPSTSSNSKINLDFEFISSCDQLDQSTTSEPKDPLNTSLDSITNSDRGLPKKCAQCNYKPDSQNDLIIHSRTHEEKEKCTYCSYKILNRAAYKVHLKFFHYDKKVECGLCKKLCFNLPQHARKEHPDENHFPMKCRSCDYNPVSYTSFFKHMEENHGKTELKECCFCDFTNICGSMLKYHMKKKHKQYERSCKYCSRKFYNEDTLLTHVRKIHEFNVHNKCDICGKTFSTKNILESHKETHKEKKIFKCKLCNLEFKTQNSLSEHTVTHPPIMKEFICDECGLTFKELEAFEEHKVKKHKLEKMFSCNFCRKSYFFDEQLKDHITKVHAGIKNFKCDICGKLFKRHYNVRLHQRVHTGEKPHVCEHCGKTFSQTNNLKKHIQQHHSDRL